MACYFKFTQVGGGHTIFNLLLDVLTNRALPDICPEANSCPFLNRNTTLETRGTREDKREKKNSSSEQSPSNELHQITSNKNVKLSIIQKQRLQGL